MDVEAIVLSIVFASILIIIIFKLYVDGNSRSMAILEGGKNCPNNSVELQLKKVVSWVTTERARLQLQAYAK